MVVGGLVLPVSIGGHPALDFCNTRAGWGSPEPKEYLSSYDHLVVWAREARLFGSRDATASCRAARVDPVGARAVLAEAIELREAAYAVLLGSRSEAAFASIATRARTARAAATMHRSPPGADSLGRWTLPVVGVNTALLGVAAALDDLLCSPLSAVVAACPGAGCGWLFADPRQRRRWCDMAVCGNRAKARRHAERLAARSAAG